jgi:hypothetical protein
MRQSDDAWYLVSANLISPVNDHKDTGYAAKSIVAKGCRFSLYVLNIIRNGATDAYWSVDLTKAKYSNSRLSTI